MIRWYIICVFTSVCVYGVCLFCSLETWEKNKETKRQTEKKMESRAETSKAEDAVKKNGESDLKKCSSPCKYSVNNGRYNRRKSGRRVRLHLGIQVWSNRVYTQGSPKVLTEGKILKSSYLPLFPPCLPGKCR